MRRARGPLVLAVLATVAAAILSPLSAAGAPAVFLGYLACLATSAAWWLLRGDGEAEPAAAGVMSALAQAPETLPPPPPPRLRELERMVATGLSSALDAQARLGPELRELACALLATRHGIDIDPESDELAGRAGLPGEPLLGPQPATRPELTQPGPPAADVGRVLDRLEII